ncbi:carboxylesterase family protein [Glycomyces sp. NPDC046736]|uniref:carboxylesterase/lipase family protein n=1 Tax=Glycomyces sp. NPDC046736 TaxID=3155615 RepID=UPI0033E2664F
MSAKTRTTRFAVGLAALGLATASIASGFAAANAEGDRHRPPTRVDTSLGTLQGSAEGAVRSWLGVPYAAPPVDELRWESPQPAEAWKGVREATEFGSACAQGEAPMPGVPSEEEDCLYLNVYAPNENRGDLPVMVWFHGGGNSYGAAEQYDPSRLVEEGAVVVTVNYRQGLFANMAHPALDEGGATTSGNWGLEDQQAAMAWVRENAEAFGGDESNLTIFGESGGGYDVCAHLTSPSSAGLFDKAIMQSAPCASTWAPTRIEGQDRDIAVAEQLGCTDRDEAEACLRALDTTAINESILGLYEVQPVDGGPVMPLATAEAIETGHVNEVPILVGINRDEQQLMTAGIEVLTGHEMTAEEYLPALEAEFGDAAAAIEARYPLSDYENPAKALAAVQTDAVWAADLAATVDALGDRGPTFAYEMSVSGAPYFSFFEAPDWELDAFHMADVAFLFDTTIFEERSPEVEPLADLMTDAWTDFARTGDPDGRGRWAEAEGDLVRQLTPEGARTVDFAEGHHLEFWSSLEG